MIVESIAKLIPLAPTPQPPEKEEINFRTIQWLVGSIAMSMPFFTLFFSSSAITSISASYYEGGWAQSVFVGFLFAIAAFLLAYNGLVPDEKIGSKIAAGAALGIALFPCACDGIEERIPHAHMICAATMFVILAYFCYLFNKRAKAKGYTEARRRARIYVACGVSIVAAIVVVIVSKIAEMVFDAKTGTLLFWCETVALEAFGFSWLTASGVLPYLKHKDKLISEVNSSAYAANTAH